MNPQEEEQLTAEIDRALRSLPELQAPSTLIRRVGAAIEWRRYAPWYQRPWQDWPLPLRAAALFMLVAFFAALYFGARRLLDNEGYVAAIHHAAGWFAALTTVWGALNALIGTFARAVQELGQGFVLCCLAIAALAWALCLGLGAACLRLVLARG